LDYSKGHIQKMTQLAIRTVLCGLVAAGMLAYGQQPQENPQPQPQTQPQTQTPDQAPKQPASAETVFAALDTNHDGKVSQDEFAKLFRDAKVSDLQAEFARWDKNGDKSLTMDEFKASYPQQ
jgi:uncharacterized membrane protein YebE (DUF533 family)